MHPFTVGALNGTRRLVRLAGLGASGPVAAEAPPVFDAEGDAASDLIRETLGREGPVMIARIGHTELEAMLRRKLQTDRSWAANARRYVTGRLGPFWWDEPLCWELVNSSGFFPCESRALEAFTGRYLADLGEVDILGSWLPGEEAVRHAFPRARRVPLRDLEPFWARTPWTTALAGRTVLVVHPFETSIRAQYARRERLFADPRVLPEFELVTLRAVQSLGGRAGDHATWFAALEAMCRRIDGMAFDIALIGAGAYGLPLAAHVKRLGRKAVHLGGASQLLFGIRGARWEERPEYAALMNGHWVRPVADEKPAGHANVDEGRSYW